MLLILLGYFGWRRSKQCTGHQAPVNRLNVYNKMYNQHETLEQGHAAVDGRQDSDQVVSKCGLGGPGLFDQPVGMDVKATTDSAGVDITDGQMSGLDSSYA